MEHTIFGLIKKRGEIAGQHKAVQQAADAIRADLDAIDRALVLCGYEDDPKGIAPRLKYKQLRLQLQKWTRKAVYGLHARARQPQRGACLSGAA
ncbi:hypothetical protein OAH97_00460 [Octadecabacter sp.]|nr:hypothetical protein [Octadecabacter sp.]